ncbi:FadR family transcriptional regulator [Microbacterium sp. ISL-59]|uniref:FadR/GntR family transcriptional regulator n=1 Tax=Microbacterium sp. ISL-59 TaxID=2819159 RepID=UPI001BE8257A|nr:FadR/GntR family transcriptional regulator [Microbacterium sp. ISL-59]MBT2495626.1 FadR family transcriptional regulator [Microbacterium sp. ISL-59]
MTVPQATNENSMYASVARHRTIDSVVDALQALILQRKLNPGDALPAERELAVMLSVSRNVVREALGILGQRGLTTSRHGYGTFVALPSGEQARAALQLLLELERVGLVELCDARLLIEPELAALAAARVTPAGASKLRDAFAALAAASADGEAHVQADLAFHGAIAEMADHTVLRALVDAVREPVTRGMVFGTKVPRAIDHSDVQHEEIMLAILAGEPELARERMREHLSYVRGYLIEHDVRITHWSAND